MNNLTNSNISVIRKSCKDNFHAFMVKGASFDGFYDIPYIPMFNPSKIKKLIPYDKTLHSTFNGDEAIHFYIDDQKFDGKYGIWSGIYDNENYKRGFSLKRFMGVGAIITPDFSLYMDMPRVMQIWNTYRNRAVGFYLYKKGFNIIPNVRWTDEESYDFAFSGLHYQQSIAISTLGCSKSTKDKILFINGFKELIKRINPNYMIIYGTVFKELKIALKYYNVNYVNFKSEISKYYGDKNGNESK